MKWWAWLLVGAAVGFVVGKYGSTIVQLWQHRDQIGAAGDVLGGVSQAWGGLEALWASRGG